MSDHRADPAAVLRRVWGYETFRPLQRAAVEGALAGRDALVVLPTGGGKSLCYQLPPAAGAGLALVVSPLIALMDDQVAAARQAGLTAASLHSNLAAGERAGAFRDAIAGNLQLLYASPERLVLGDLMEALAPRLGLIAVDEAHCVSHWGHDFRPEYRQLAPLFAAAPRVPRMALTATATPAVQRDIIEQLALRDPLVLIGHPDRPNLVYRAFPRHDTDAQLLAAVRRHPDEGGIVYAQTRREVERIAARLQGTGVRAAPYHAGLGAAERAATQTAFLNEDLHVVVATIAFGMGIDRSNVRFVVHANAPRSVEHYQQESGRAGRDGLPADCTLLYSAADLQAHRRLAEMDGPLPEERKNALERQLAQIARFAVAPVCRHRLLSEHFGRPWPPPPDDDTAVVPPPAPAGEPDNCRACDVCLGETVALPGDEALAAAQKILSAVLRTGSTFGAAHVTAVLRGSDGERIHDLRHHELSVHGLLRDESDATVRAWIDQLIAQDILEMVEKISGARRFPIVQVTEQGRAVLRGHDTPRLTRFWHGAEGKGPTPKGKRTKRAAAAAHAGEEWTGVDTDLFERLRALRREIAQRESVPPYVVFSDATLREMARLKPRNEAELLEVKGVGETKLARYGELFLAAIGE
ncbi:MAG: RecQ family ATP-dependent DNA helicase [Candidatus Krumholzibacteriia bacterium]